jgi:hypothetical protein
VTELAALGEVIDASGIAPAANPTPPVRQKATPDSEKLTEAAVASD